MKPYLITVRFHRAGVMMKGHEFMVYAGNIGEAVRLGTEMAIHREGKRDRQPGEEDFVKMEADARLEKNAFAVSHYSR